MTEEEMMVIMAENIDLGFAIKHDDGSFSMTPAGRAYVEQVIIPGVTDPGQIFALALLQGLSEADSTLQALKDAAAIAETVEHGLRANRDDAEHRIAELEAEIANHGKLLNAVENERDRLWAGREATRRSTIEECASIFDRLPDAMVAHRIAAARIRALGDYGD